MKHFVRRMQAFAASLVIVAAGVQAQKAPGIWTALSTN